MYGMAPVRVDCPTCAEPTVADLIDWELSAGDGTATGGRLPAVDGWIPDGVGACVNCGTAFVIDPSLYQPRATASRGPARTSRVAA
ncbi:hypothetical protein SAMN05444157_2218 [Frankineae bacterium MT45]|nr:hypothetical protein SAMN05444157_2218 [Frankineae bacterium MT45]